ncbi:MAG: hypothetical protein M1823_001748 [Watsoniomyces obsoletus]|nr:MAG: hypothetical protein M1823_001748 [Watsoniomyces obsoletus]
MYSYFETDDGKTAKCYLTHGRLPAEIDPKNPPTKRQPFSAPASIAFTHTLEMIMPEEAYHAIKERVFDQIQPIQYSVVIMPLSGLLEPDFLNTYIKPDIKQEEVMMLSEGRPGIDNQFWLHRGVLRLSIDRETYERCGLVGTPNGRSKSQPGRKRWLVTIDLRVPAMRPGKKGFQRVQRAAERVLNQSIKWLFCDVSAREEPSPRPIDRYHPIHKKAVPHLVRLESVQVPQSIHTPIPPPEQTKNHWDREDKDEHATALHEWLGLISLNSPRIRKDDTIDPFLARYAVPDASTASTTTLVKIRWNGFIPATWVSGIWRQTLFAIRASASTHWFAMSAQAFRLQQTEAGRTYTILRQAPSGPVPTQQSSLTSTTVPESTEASPREDAFCCWEIHSQ